MERADPWQSEAASVSAQTMRVGLVTTWAECGAGHVSLAYARALTAHGCEVAIYSRGQYLREQRWSVSDSRPWPLESDRCVDGLTRVDRAQFARWLRRFRPDWLIFNEQRAWGPVLQARAAGIRCAAYVDYYRSDTVDLFELYDLLLCHTQRHYRVFAADERARFVAWGVDTDHFSPGVRQSALIGSEEPLVFVHSAGMGGPSDRKGTDLALSAFRAVRGHAEFLMHTQLPRERWPRAWHEALAGDSRIRVLEGILDPVSLYRQGDVYVYPSRLEGIGLTLPEALSCGLAAIATDSPPMSEFVQHGVTGSVVPVLQYRGRCDGYYWPEAWVDADALARCMQAYVDQPSLARQQGGCARVRMVADRHWPHLAEAIIPLLKSVGSRVIQLDSLAGLRRHSLHQDRLTEPTAVDGLVQAAACVLKGMRRRLQRGA